MPRNLGFVLNVLRERHTKNPWAARPLGAGAA
jgi:hypothetical protein